MCHALARGLIFSHGPNCLFTFWVVPVNIFYIRNPSIFTCHVIDVIRRGAYRDHHDATYYVNYLIYFSPCSGSEGKECVTPLLGPFYLPTVPTWGAAWRHSRPSPSWGASCPGGRPRMLANSVPIQPGSPDTVRQFVVRP